MSYSYFRLLCPRFSTSMAWVDESPQATDVAARGLDVPGIEHIVNFDLPNDGGPATDGNGAWWLLPPGKR